MLSLNDGRSMNKNRRSLDIVREVLSIALVKVRKTKIMYGANLNFLQVEKYLRILQGSGLLEFDGDSGYLITETGLEFLQLYEAYLERSTRLREDVERNMRDRLRLENMCFNSKAEASKIGIGKDVFE